MCGRFTLAAAIAELKAQFEDVEFPSQFAPRYNIAPSQPILAIPNDGHQNAAFYIWGLVPSWSKDPAIGTRLINARAETLAEKPAFRGPFKYKRCLIPADGFYEWKASPRSKLKVPHYIRMENLKPFAFAGLWSDWQSGDGTELRTCTILTTLPNSLVAGIHNRMPVILRQKDYSTWIDPEPRSDQELASILKPYPAEEMVAFPVSTLVNSPNNDRPECVLPA